MYTILMVDDERPILQIRSTFLIEKGCIVHGVTTAVEALGMVKVCHYDCILLDVKLPEMSGFVLCSRLHEITDSPIIFVSSLTDDESQIEGFLSGGADYITKEAGLPLFWAKIETRIRLSGVGTLLLNFGDLSIDLPARKVKLGGKELLFTSLEFDILTLLATKPLQVFSPDEIYREVWGAESLDHWQAVQVHMSRMRRKLEKAFPRHYFIETVWGKGYQFIPIDSKND